MDRQSHTKTAVMRERGAGSGSEHLDRNTIQVTPPIQ